MGWTTGWRTKDEAFKAVGLNCEVRERKAAKDGDWLIVFHEGREKIVVVRLKRYGKEDWGEGGVWGETSGPYEDGCPVKWFDRVPVPSVEEVGEQSHQWAVEFRAGAIAEHNRKLAAKERAKQFAAGSRVKLPENWKPNGPFTLAHKSGKSWIVTTDAGRQMKLGPKALAAAELAAA